jgi:hypothetical protein
MSIKLMAKIWDVQIKERDGLSIAARKFILLRLADVANDEGENVKLGVKRIARETGLSDRTVQKAIAGFVDEDLMELIAEEDPYLRKPRVYKLHVENISKLASLKADASGTGAASSPGEAETPRNVFTPPPKTTATPPEEASGNPSLIHKKDAGVCARESKPFNVSRSQWEVTLNGFETSCQYASRNGKVIVPNHAWHPANGPRPGEPGCRAPPDLVATIVSTKFLAPIAGPSCPPMYGAARALNVARYSENLT